MESYRKTYYFSLLTITLERTEFVFLPGKLAKNFFILASHIRCYLGNEKGEEDGRDSR